MHKLIPVLLLALLFLRAGAQDTDLLLNHPVYHYLDRLDIQGLTDTLVPNSVRPMDRATVAQLLRRSRRHASSGSRLLAGWHERMEWLVNDSLAQPAYKGLWNTFYTNKRDLGRVKQGPLELYINPILHTSLGVDRNDFPTAGSPNLPLYYNSRGLMIRGSLYGKVGFQTEVFDNILRVPQFVYDHFAAQRTLPGETRVKTFGDQNGVDFLGSRAYLTFRPIPAVRLKFGKDRAFWGNGFQSLSLSDHAADYLFLNLTTRIWRLTYVNHFTQLTDFIPNWNDNYGRLPKKFAVFHQLTYHPWNNFSFSLFESLVYQPSLPNGLRGPEWSYFNPVIFFRAAEQVFGSSDNAFLGAQAKWNFLQRFQLYGQFLIDDVNIGIRDQGSGYYGNKIGWQLGGRYIDVAGVEGLDFQAEYNRLRPFTYQHFSVSANYSHYGQSLGHSFGANLYDMHLILRYQPKPAWNLYASYSMTAQGLDSASVNFGGDIGRVYTNRVGDFNHEVTQGNRLDIQQFYGRISYQLMRSDNYLEGEVRYRRERDQAGLYSQQSFSLMLGLRAHLSPRRFLY
ncbi:MAG: hypothetical protein AAFR61_14670 [Bacteroidota bacterium]